MQPAVAKKMDSGADLLVAFSKQEDEQRLRAATGKRRSVHLRGHEPLNGKAVGSLMRLFRQFQGEVCKIPLVDIWMNSLF
jgi:hypothetical protein